MLRHPDEGKRSEEVAGALRKEFGFAERVYDFWLRQPKEEHLERSRLSERVKGLAIALNVQACRQFRTVIELCRRCEAHCARILGRSLYETAIATCFVLKPRFYVRFVPICDKGTGEPRPKQFKVTPPVAGDRSNKVHVGRHLRATLYLASSAFQDEVFRDRLQRNPRRKHLAKLVTPDREFLEEMETDIGPEWTFIMRKSPTYSGLSLSELTAMLGNDLDTWRDAVYPFQCRSVHGAEAFRHVEQGEGGRIQVGWFSTTDEVSGELEAAVTWFLACLSFFHDYVRLGTTTGMGLHKLRKEFKKLFRA